MLMLVFIAEESHLLERHQIRGDCLFLPAFQSGPAFREFGGLFQLRIEFLLRSDAI